METTTVRKGNATFLVVTVGMSFGMSIFADAVLDSDLEMSQFPTDGLGDPGYIRIDSSAIRDNDIELWWAFVEKVRNRFLGSVPNGFSSQTEFDGDLADKVTLEKDGYRFSLHIREYERDSEHGFEIIKPKHLADIPEDEKLGRVVYLTITPDQPTT